LSTKRKASSASMRPNIYQTICVPRYSGLVLDDVNESIDFNVRISINTNIIAEVKQLQLLTQNSGRGEVKNN
jgi:hypothetical protein